MLAIALVPAALLLVAVAGVATAQTSSEIRAIRDGRKADDPPPCATKTLTSC